MKLKRLIFRHHTLLYFNLRFLSNDIVETTEVKPISFFDTEVAFMAKSTTEIVRALAVFKMCSIKILVDHNMKAMEWARKIFGQRLFEELMKKTIYGHFVAGVNHDDIRPLVKLYRQFGVKAILDYSVEKDLNEDDSQENKKEPLEITIDDKDISFNLLDFEHNTETFLKSIDASASCTNNGEGIIALKVTALGSPELLVQISNILVQLENIFKIFGDDLQQQATNLLLNSKLERFYRTLRDMGIEISDKGGFLKLIEVYDQSIVDLFQWLFQEKLCFHIKDHKTGITKQFLEPISKNLLLSLKFTIQRLNKIAQHAKTKNVQVMIDAEQSYMQPAIRRITMDLMRRYNNHQCLIINTYQCYLKKSFDHLRYDLHCSLAGNFYFGAKLVRGAYMNQEHERAHLYDYESPINESFDSTTKMYYECMELAICAIRSRPQGEIQITIASHNPDTIKHAIQRFHEFQIHPNDSSTSFAQLLGMCDQISFTLGHLGYSVYKYMPYGPVNDVLPFLSRRALENRAVIGKCKDEQTLLWQELLRRFKTGSIFKYPRLF